MYNRISWSENIAVDSLNISDENSLDISNVNSLDISDENIDSFIDKDTLCLQKKQEKNNWVSYSKKEGVKFCPSD